MNIRETQTGYGQNKSSRSPVYEDELPNLSTLSENNPLVNIHQAEKVQCKAVHWNANNFDPKACNLDDR